jgi:large subunit ribosomal protein L22
METRASAKYIRVSPQKARLVVDLVRGKDVADAQQILDYSPKAAARIVSKILSSAIANAEHNNGLNPDVLYVAGAYVDEGPTLKRFRPRAMGRATRINKRTSHITLVLDERESRPGAKRRRLPHLPRRARKEEAPAEPLQAEVDEAELDADETAAEPEAPLRADADSIELDADETAGSTEEAEADHDMRADEEKDAESED